MSMDTWPDRPRILISYAYLQGHPSLAKYAGDDLLVDSGAFTAWSLGKPPSNSHGSMGGLLTVSG